MSVLLKRSIKIIGKEKTQWFLCYVNRLMKRVFQISNCLYKFYGLESVKNLKIHYFLVMISYLSEAFSRLFCNVLSRYMPARKETSIKMVYSAEKKIVLCVQKSDLYLRLYYQINGTRKIININTLRIHLIMLHNNNYLVKVNMPTTKHELRANIT